MTATGNTAHFWGVAVEHLFVQLRTSAEGLTTAEAVARKQPLVGKRNQAWHPLKLLLRQFKSPLVLILVVGAVLSLVLR